MWISSLESFRLKPSFDECVCNKLYSIMIPWYNISDHWHHVFVFEGSNKIFSSVTTWPVVTKICWNDVWNVLYKIPQFVSIGQTTWLPVAMQVSNENKIKILKLLDQLNQTSQEWPSTKYLILFELVKQNCSQRLLSVWMVKSKKKSFLKSLDQFKPSFAGTIYRRFSTQISHFII